MRGNPTARRTQPSLPASQALAPCTRQPGFRARRQVLIFAPNLRSTSQDMRSENHCTSPSLLRTTHQSESVGPDSPEKAQHQLSPSKLRILIPCYTSYNTISPTYTPLPGVMTALALRTSLILVVEFHAVCRCTICGAQVDSEARIPGITMTARVDIFTNTVTTNQQTPQPKFPNKICDSHPE